ncbi:hypothetical protein C2I17_01090 [Niallia circulans]|jgi:hypothetical protein|uniref:hypothetical protein n=1 Tax=Niallia circulans TaxID=1397 RepID=UPI00201E71A3|nr:hypothetical protein [Niallia circulans]UQZ73267.1 hypothetical protein C2I17_01090 [Niallia circulans]
MTKNGWLSLLMVGICIILSLFLSTKSAGIFFLLFPILSLSGIIFAIFSKKWSNIILGVLLNGAAGVFFTLLAFAVGFGET